MKWLVDQLHRFINKLSLPCLKHKRNCLLHNQKFYEIVIESQNHRIIKNIPYLHSQQPQPQQNQTSYSTAVLSRYICICIVAYLIASTFGVILFLKYDIYPSFEGGRKPSRKYLSRFSTSWLQKQCSKNVANENFFLDFTNLLSA